MAKATCGQILANHISVFSVDLDELPRYVAVRVMAFFCLCTAVFIEDFLCIPGFPLTTEKYLRQKQQRQSESKHRMIVSSYSLTKTKIISKICELVADLVSNEKHSSYPCTSCLRRVLASTEHSGL